MATKVTKSKACAECGAGNTYTRISGIVVCRTCGWQSEENADLEWKSPDATGPIRMAKWFQELQNTSFANLNTFKTINDTFKFISELEREYSGIKLEVEVVKWREWHEDKNKKPKAWRNSLRNWLNKAKEGPPDERRKAEATSRVTAGKPVEADPFADLSA